MQALASIAVLEDGFVGLRLPTYREYQRPDERTLNASTVSQTITAHLQKFTERAPGRGVTAEATRRAQQDLSGAVRHTTLAGRGRHATRRFAKKYD